MLTARTRPSTTVTATQTRRPVGRRLQQTAAGQSVQQSSWFSSSRAWSTGRMHSLSLFPSGTSATWATSTVVEDVVELAARSKRWRSASRGGLGSSPWGWV